MKQFRLWLALASLFAIVAARAGAGTLAEYFTSDPSQDGWQVFGDTNLFQWDSTNQVLDVTWDSSQTNSYLYHSLGTTLTRSNDFTIAFDIQLNQATASGFGFQIALGLFNLSEATNSAFQRSTGANSPDLVEFDYFPDVGFGPTTWPLFVDSNSVFNYNGSSDYAIYAPILGDWYHVVMTYTATNQTMVTTMTNFEQTSGITIVDPLDAGFAGFNVDTLSISSYQDDGLGDSIFAQGAIGNLVVTIPTAAPVPTTTENLNFASDPLQDGWQVFGDTNLFQWDSTNEVLDVTWDSTQTNSYFYHPLGTTLTRSNNFSVAFDMQVNQATASGYGFQLAVGLFNQAEATNSAFQRSTGENSPDLVEFDYFPDVGYGPTVWPLFVDSNSVFNYNGPSDYAIYAPNTGDWYHVVMTYTAANQTMVTTLTNFEQTSGITIVDPLEAGFAGFNVDTLSISSYQDDGFGDSIQAQGAVGNFVVTIADPHIEANPAPTGVVVGQNANFTVTADGLSTLTYRWLQNGTNVVKEPGALTSSLTITNTKTAFSNYLYSVVVSDGNGSVTSAPVKLSVASKAVTVGAVASKTVFAGQPVTFSTSVSGGVAPTYQWYSNNVVIAGATFVNYTNLLVNFGDAGGYYVAVSDATLGSPINSAHATLTVNVPEKISNPMATTVRQGQLFTLKTMVSNNTKLPYVNTFQWYSNNVAIPGATFASYTNSVDNTNGSGPTVVDYTVVVNCSFADVSTNLTSAIGAVTVIPDTSAPMLAISYPASNATLTNNLQVTNSGIILAGTASDNAHVSQVFVSLNGGAYQPASVTDNPSVASVKWSLPITPAVGTNTVSAYSVDFAGNLSKTNTRGFFFAVPADVTVTVSGDGIVTMTNLFDSVTPNSLVSTTRLFVNRTYTLTATAAHDNLFSNWVDNTDTTIAATNKFTFTAETQLDLTANFVTNQFLAFKGTYYGLFSDTNDGVSEPSAGWFTATVTPSDSKQSFSASLFVDGDSLSGIAGTFDLAGGSTVVTVPRRGKAPLTVSLQLNFDDTIGGTVIDSDNWTSTASGDLSTYSTANPSPYAGTYNLLIPGFNDPTVGPAGYGYATMKIATNGVVTASGSLADGQALSLQTAAVSTNGDVPVYSKAYVYEFNNGTATIVSYQGALLGWLKFSNSTPGGNLFWLKNANPTNVYYNGGFSNETAVAGSAYNRAPVTPPGGFLITNGLVTFSGGNLTSNITDNVSVSNAVVKIIGTTNQLKSLTFMPSSGAVSGTFTNTAAHTAATFKGLYTPGTNDLGTNVIGGWFLGTSQGGSLFVQPQ